jgi:uncharacterized phage protein (TIGR02216 family)
VRLFPWDAAMRIGFGRLRLSPHAFWALTAPELVQIARALMPVEPARLQRSALNDLMMRFPDAE